MSGRTARLAIGILGSVWALAGEAVAMSAGRSPNEGLLHLAIGLTYLYGGLAIWDHEPANRTGRLMTLVGLTWFIATFTASPWPIVRELALALEDTPTIILLALVLAYPSGRLTTRIDRAAVLILAVGATGLNVLFATSLPIIGDKSGGLYGGLALATMTAAVVAWRWLRVPRRSRRDLNPVLVAGVVLLAGVTLNLVRRIWGVPEDVGAILLAVRDLAPAAIPVALLIEFYRQSEHRLQALVTVQRAADVELRRSRARIVEATDAERRRLERDLHDGAQQRLVSLSLALRLLRSRLADRDDPDDEAIAAVDEAAAELRIAIRELRELARGIHPAILTEAGLGAAMTSLAERSVVPAVVSALPDRRLPQTVEATAYFVVSEALANVTKYASATHASVGADCRGDMLHVEVGDDGVGGADASRGTGIRGLQDRVAALGGRVTIDSPPGRGTIVIAEIPIA